MEKRQTFNSSTAIRKVFMIFAAVAMLITFAAVSASADAASKKPEPKAKTDAQKLADAAKWAKQTVKNYEPLKANPNPKGLAPGVGLTVAYARTPVFLALNEYTRFLERARPVKITEEARRSRTKVIYTRYHKARAYAYSRTVQRRGIAKSYVNKERRKEVLAAETKHDQEVLAAVKAFQKARAEVQAYRKKMSAKLKADGRKKKNAIRKQIKKLRSSKLSRGKKIRLRGKLRGKFIKVIENSKAKHTTNALRYSIKVAHVTSVRDARVSQANKTLTAEVQAAEDRASKRTDNNMAYINNRTGVEVSLATTWRSRAIQALRDTKHKVIKKAKK